MSLKNNTQSLQEVLEILSTKASGGENITEEIETYTNLNEDLEQVINSLPEVGSVELPALENPATSNEIVEGYEAIDQNGNIIVGTYQARSTFTVYNSTELIFTLNGVTCLPGETTAVPYSDYFLQSFLLINEGGWTIEEMHFTYEYEDDDGEIIQEYVGVICPNLVSGDYVLCGYSEIIDNCTFIATYYN